MLGNGYLIKNLNGKADEARQIGNVSKKKRHYKQLFGVYTSEIATLFSLSPMPIIVGQS